MKTLLIIDRATGETERIPERANQGRGHRCQRHAAKLFRPDESRPPENATITSGLPSLLRYGSTVRSSASSPLGAIVFHVRQ